MQSLLTTSTLSAVLLLLLLSQPSSGASIPEHIMKDPSFLQCLSQHSAADPVDYVAIVASCYGFVGRPRFGKRSDPLESVRLNTPDYFWRRIINHFYNLKFPEMTWSDWFSPAR